MLVDMYKISDIRSCEAFVNTLKKMLNDRPPVCLGVRLLVNLDIEGGYMVVSYWPDRHALSAGTATLHQEIREAAEDFGGTSVTEKYDIVHDI